MHERWFFGINFELDCVLFYCVDVLSCLVGKNITFTCKNRVFSSQIIFVKFLSYKIKIRFSDDIDVCLSDSEIEMSLRVGSRSYKDVKMLNLKLFRGLR